MDPRRQTAVWCMLTVQHYRAAVSRRSFFGCSVAAAPYYQSVAKPRHVRCLLKRHSSCHCRDKGREKFGNARACQKGLAEQEQFDPVETIVRQAEAQIQGEREGSENSTSRTSPDSK